MERKETFMRTLPTAYPCLQGKNGAPELIVAFSAIGTAMAMESSSGDNRVTVKMTVNGKEDLINGSLGLAPTDGGYTVSVTFWRKDAERIDAAAQRARNAKGENKRGVFVNLAGALRVFTKDDGTPMLVMGNAWLGDVQPVIAKNQSQQGYNGAPQGGYAPNGAPQGGYAPNGAPQGGYAPNGAPQGGYAPNGAPRGSYNPNGAPQGGYAPNGAPQGVYAPNGAPQGVYAPNGAPQGGYAPNGAPQGGYAPNGAPQGGYAPNGAPQGGYAQNGAPQRQQGNAPAPANGYAPQGGNYAAPAPAPQGQQDFATIDEDDGDLPF